MNQSKNTERVRARLMARSGGAGEWLLVVSRHSRGNPYGRTNASVSLALAFVGGVAGVLFVGLSTVVVQAMSSDEFRARALAIWAAAFVGMLPFGRS
jgi:hypothetical protein